MAWTQSALAAGEDIENPFVDAGDGEKKAPSKKKNTKAAAPQPVIPAHLLNKNKNKQAKRTEMRNVEGTVRQSRTHARTHARKRD
jgi:hypothetical protein